MALGPQQRPGAKIPPRVQPGPPPGPGGPRAGSPSGSGGPQTNPPPSPSLPRGRIWFWFLLILLINFLVGRWLFPQTEGPATVPYTFFKEQVSAGNVQAIFSRGDAIAGRFRKPVLWPPAPAQSTDSTGQASRPAGEAEQANRPATGPSGPAQPASAPVAKPEPSRQVSSFKTILPAFVGPGLEGFLIDHGVEISARQIEGARNPWVTLLFSIGPALLLIVFYIWIFRRFARQGGGLTGGLMGIGRSRARRYDQEEGTKVTFRDVAGIDEAENELVEVVDFLKDPAKYTRLGGEAPKGVLLVGAPGTGKTLLAKAVAGEAGVPFFSMSAAEFVEMIVGVGAARVRDLFKQAREQAPAIIFIDELDAIGRARGQMSIGGASEQEQTLNQILTEMDGFSSREGIIVLAATNQPDVLDKALLRPGRFDRRVIVNLPDKAGREAILKVHTRGIPLAPDASLDEVAAATPGFTGADLKNLCNEAALLAARRGQEEVHRKDFVDSLEKIVLGPERPILLTSEDKERIAYHEGGHAILGLLIKGADPVNRVTVVPRGQALGVTYQRPDRDRYNYPEAYLRARITGMLGGRAAEEIVYGTRTTGAESDIEQATRIARLMVTRWGMSDRLGMVQLAPRENPYLTGWTGGSTGAFGNERPFSDGTAAAIDEEVQKIIHEGHAEARKLLTEHRRELDALAAALVARETLDEEEILQVTGLTRAPALDGSKFPTSPPPEGAEAGKPA